MSTAKKTPKNLEDVQAALQALITQGRSNEEITVACYLSINTVKTYIRSAYI